MWEELKELRKMWKEAGCTWSGFFEYLIEYRKKDLVLVTALLVTFIIFIVVILR